MGWVVRDVGQAFALGGNGRRGTRYVVGLCHECQ